MSCAFRLAHRRLSSRSRRWRFGQEKPGVQSELKAAGWFEFAVHLTCLQSRCSMKQSPESDRGLSRMPPSDHALHLFNSKAPEALARRTGMIRCMKTHEYFVEITIVPCEMQVSASHPADCFRSIRAMGGFSQGHLQSAGAFIREGCLKRRPVRKVAIECVRREAKSSRNVSKRQIANAAARQLLQRG